MRECIIGQVADAVVHVDFDYEEGAKSPFLPVVRDINVERVSSRNSKHALFLRAFPNAAITDVKLRDCQFDDIANASVLENVLGLRYDHVTSNGKPT